MSSRVAHPNKAVNRKTLRSPKRNTPSVEPKLSALALAIKLLAKHEGITSTAQLVRITGYCKRSVCRAKAELGVTPVSPQDRGDARVTRRVTPVSQRAARIAASPPLKKKGLPHTPSKEKTNPPSGSTLESKDSASHRAAARELSSLPASEQFIEHGGVRLSLEAIDEHASIAGIAKGEARSYAKTLMFDWVTREDVPKYPMRVFEVCFSKWVASKRIAAAGMSRQMRDAALEHGMGRG